MSAWLIKMEKNRKLNKFVIILLKKKTQSSKFSKQTIKRIVMGNLRRPHFPLC